MSGREKCPGGICPRGNVLHCFYLSYPLTPPPISCNPCWCVCSSDGRYTSGLTGAKLAGPKGVCAEPDGQGRVAVVDNKGRGIVVYGEGGHHIGTFGTRGREINQLSGPQYCAFLPARFTDQSPSVVVTDFHNHNVKVRCRRNLSCRRPDNFCLLRNHILEI